MSGMDEFLRDDLPVPYLERAMKRSFRDVQNAAALAKTGVSELSQTHMYASDTVERTIAAAYQLVEAAEMAGELPHHKQVVIYHLTQAYVHEMLAVSDEVAAAITVCLQEYGR